MRRATSGTSTITRNLFGLSAARAPLAASVSSQSLRTGGTSSLLTRGFSLAPSTTRSIFVRHTNLGPVGRPARRFIATGTDSATSNGYARIAAIGVIVAAVGGVTGIVYATEGNQEEDGFFNRMKAKFEAHKNKILNIDSNKKVLPDPHPPPYGKPITVVISDDVLLKQEYQPMSGGMLTKKRPGVEFFLAQLSQEYELVIWSLQPVQSFGPVIEKLDPNHHALHRLFVDATVVSEGVNNVKDLVPLDRPLDKTIVIDIDTDRVVQKENLIVAPKYDGALEDVYLLELLNFFRLLSASSKSSSGVPDVRLWVAALQKNGVKYFKDKYIEAVKKARERAEEERRKREEQLQMREGSTPARKW